MHQKQPPARVTTARCPESSFVIAGACSVVCLLLFLSKIFSVEELTKLKNFSTLLSFDEVAVSFALPSWADLYTYALTPSATTAASANRISGIINASPCRLI